VLHVAHPVAARRLAIGPAARTTVILSGVVALGALPLLLPRNPGAIALTEQQIGLEAEPDQVFQQLSSFEQGPRIVERSANQIVAEFPVRVGWYQLTTLERITLDPDRRRLTFEQLRSPFFSLRTATEAFELSSRPGGGTVLTVRGVLWPRLGAFGWVVTNAVVRPRWDQIEAQFLARLRQRIPGGGNGEPQAAESRGSWSDPSPS
jgi:hypothetical protein